MLNRRHIRIKVMQSIYAMQQQQESDLNKQERFLLRSIEDILDLYLIVSSSLIAIQKMEIDFLNKSKQKRIRRKEDEKPNLDFVNNAILQILASSVSLQNHIERRKINNWSIDDSYLKLIITEIKASDLYVDYMKITAPDFTQDQTFIINIFTEIIAPNIKLNEYLEDLSLSWSDDIPIVNTLFVKQLTQCKNKPNFTFKVPDVYKDLEDKEFGQQLFRKVVLRNSELAAAFSDKTPNWDNERIAELDSTILKMAIAEFLFFPSVPVKVTINEYVEIAKEYATPKSSIFINGILDKISKEYQEKNQLQKIGRGLL